MEKSYEHIYNIVEEMLDNEKIDDTNILYLINKSYDENSHSAILCRLLNILPYRNSFFPY
ncbi:MAG: hypothetical protein ACRCV0_03280 [Brevinema sp.]